MNENPTPVNPAYAPPEPRRWLVPAMVAGLAASLLAVAVLATVLAVRPTSTTTRTITAPGEATVKAAPDEYIFYPSYNFTAADKDAALADMSKKSDQVVSGLKKLGVADKAIKTNSSGYDSSPGPVYYNETMPIRKDNATYTLQLTVTVDDKNLAQKVQDYLVTTTPSGGVSPQTTFSDAKRKQLESQARDEATKDARAKADQMAKNLGFKVGKVRSVTDGSGFGVMTMEGKAVAPMAADSGVASSPSISVQPGENELAYSVTVIYEIK